MLRALQADVNAWPQRVKEAGVTNAGGAAYVPVARNLEILRTPDDPQATFAYMRRAWEAPDAESGSAGWDRVIAQAGPRATWEWLMADPDKPYAPLFDDLRERVTDAFRRHPATRSGRPKSRRRPSLKPTTRRVFNGSWTRCAPGSGNARASNGSLFSFINHGSKAVLLDAGGTLRGDGSRPS